MEGERKRILLVEDETILAMLESQQLEGMGYQVVHSHSGEDAVGRVRDSGLAFDAILMDIDLGRGMDGTEAAEAILAAADIPIVFLSSHTEPEIVRKTEGISSYGYVVKNSGIVVLDASIKMAFKLFAEKLEHARAERLQLLSTAVLGVLNKPLSLRETSQAILSLIKEGIGVDAVGIRLAEREDFPYFCEEGFDQCFLSSENSLLGHDESGQSAGTRTAA
jgi:CheY-like chemotaxis protein